jgi:signal transduction histidine kinase/CheY-like chemotaxis protein
MTEVRGFDIVFPREYLRAALMVSLMSVWVLVGLFYYLNRYTQRTYFTIWTAAWLFYALWLTIGITMPNAGPQSFIDLGRQWCVSISAVFLLWGSLSFLGIPARQMLFGLFLLFLLTWSYVGGQITDDPFLMQLPHFVLIGLASMFAGVSFYRERQRRRFVGVGMLFLGFLLWGVYLVLYPFSQKFEALITAGFLFSAVLQLFIAVSMIVLVLEEARYLNEAMLAQIHSVNTEKEELELKVISSAEQCRSLFEAARLRDELQEAHDRLRQTQQSVLQQERLRALGQMASGVAHDINNALSPIVAFSELLLKKETRLGPESRKNLEHIHTSAEDIVQIVARMGEFYRRRDDSEQLHLTNVNELVQQVLDMTRPSWHDIAQRKGIMVKVETHFDGKLPELYCNASELREALTNLVLNSVDALPAGGRITLSTRAFQPQKSPPTDVPSHVVLEVRDNGVGMDESTRQRCLEPFFSTKTQRGGTGLGLAMVYGATERHQGSIEVESKLGKGTTVRLVFPLRQPPVVETARSEPGVSPPTSLRILCIDDEPLLRELLKELLGYCQHEVETADGGQSGLDAFFAARNGGHPFDVVITDLGMPCVDGRQVTEQIKATSPNTAVIMLTGWGTLLDGPSEKQHSKVDALVSKPPRLEELNRTLLRVAATVRRPNPAPLPDFAPPVGPVGSLRKRAASTVPVVHASSGNFF